MDNESSYYTLGRSGLRVSRLCLGTATFGVEHFGVNEDISKAIFNQYIERGGNFIDTSNNYGNGLSESILGQVIQERNLREHVVLGTKYTMNPDPKNPSLGGNGRKNMYSAIEQSLRRLKTDYIDMYWLYLWDTVTPVEEVVRALSDLVRDGKIRHYGFSNVPAWYATRAYSLAEQEHRERPIALQLEYSLIERHIEHEHVPVSQELGFGNCIWSPLAGGFLSGKYKRDGASFTGKGRINTFKEFKSPFLPEYAEREWEILNAVYAVADELDKSPAQVALNWAVNQPGITCANIGATSVTQLDENLSSLSFDLPEALMNKMTALSQLDAVYPYKIFAPTFQATVNGDNRVVHGWAPHGVNG